MSDIDVSTLDEQVACVAREVAMRKNVYPRFVKNLRMTQAEASHELAMMQAAYQTLCAVRDEHSAQLPLFGAKTKGGDDGTHG